MTRDEFETMFTATYPKALNAARKVSPVHAEDAVSDAVIYLLENLERFQQITPSYFIQTCVNRARNLVRDQHSDLIYLAGDETDLAQIEEHQAERATGRVRRHRGAE